MTANTEIVSCLLTVGIKLIIGYMTIYSPLHEKSTTTFIKLKENLLIFLKSSIKNQKYLLF